MSNKIDQRIVEMSFENHKFEKGIKESSGSLKEFAKALTDMGSRNNSFDGLEKSVKSATNSFSIFEQVAIGALRQVGATAITTTANLTKSLSIDQLTAGLSKYEQKNASVQTIMNATGKSIDEINGYLDKLMWFSDETSYGFTDMTAALGQMTSTGGDIDKLIPMITGVANATAYAGKGAGEFSRAMYNLNQSYGTGSLKFMDWKSLELAGVASKELKQIFIDTAAELGKFDKIYGSIANAPVTLGTFGETLKDNWADTEVMEKAFGKFSELSEASYELVDAGKFDTAAEAMRELSGQYSEIAEKAFKSAQQAKTFTEAIDATKDAVSTGWMKTAEIIFGDLPEATANFTKLTDILWTIFASGADARNSMLGLIKAAGGIKSIFQSLKNVSIAFLTPLKAVSEAMDQFFPPKTEDQWMSIITSIESFTSKLIMSEERADQVRRTFAGFFAVVDIGWQVLKLTASAVLEIVKVIVPFNGTLLEATARVGDFLVGMNAAIKHSGFFQYSLLAIKIAVFIVRDAIASAIDGIKQFAIGMYEADNPLKYFQTRIKKTFASIFDYVKMVLDFLGKNIPNTFSNIGEIIKDIFGEDTHATLKKIFEVLKEGAVFIGGYVVDSFREFGSAIRDLDLSKVTAFVIGGILLMFVTQLTDLSKAMTNFVTTAGAFLGNINKKMFSSTTQIKDLAFAIGVLTASLFVLSQLPTKELTKGLLGIAGALVILVAAYGGIQAINVYATKSLKGSEMAGSAFGLVGLAASLAIMASALRTISKIDPNTVVQSTMVMGAMIGFLAAYQASLKDISAIPGDGKATVNLVAMALGLAAISKAIYVVNKIPQEQLDSGMLRIAGIMAVIASIQAVLSVSASLSKGYTLSANLISISTSILALVMVMKLISGISMEEIKQGSGKLIAVGIVLATIETLFGLASSLGGGSKFQTNILKVSAGILSMIALIAILGSIPDTTLTQGLTALTKITAVILAIELITAQAAKLAGGAKLQRILGSVTLTMLGFVGIIGVLTSFKDQSEFNTAYINLLKIAALVLTIEVVTAAISHFSGDIKGFGLLIATVGSILSLTASIALLSLIPKEMLENARNVLVSAGISLGGMAIAFSMMINALSSMATVSVTLKGLITALLPAILGLGVVVGATAIFITLFKSFENTIKSIDLESIVKFTTMAGLIGALVIAFSAIPIKGNSDFSALIGGFGALAGVLAMTTIFFYALEGILPIVQKVTPENMMTITVAIGALTAVFAAFALLGPALKKVGDVPGQVLSGTVVAIIGVGGVLAAFVGLVRLANDFVASSEKLEIGINKITTLSAGIGRMVGAFVGGMAIESLIGIGEALSGFGNALGSFDPSAVEGIAALAKALLLITGTAVLDGFVSFRTILGGGAIKTFGKDVKKLISIFASLSEGEVIAASKTMSSLVPMAEGLSKLSLAAKDIPNSGGVIGFFAGNNDLDKFAVKISNFIRTLTDGIDSTSAKRASDIIVTLSPMGENLSAFSQAAKDIPNSGGVIGFFAGNNDLDKFAEKISAFISTLTRGGLSSSMAKQATTIVGELAPMAENLSTFSNAARDLPKSGGVIGFFAGNNNIGKFGKQLNSFVSGIITNNLTAENVRQAQSVMNGSTLLATNFVEFMDVIKGTRIGVAEIKSMVDFAGHVKRFVNTLKGVDFSIVQPALKSISNITLSFENIGAKVMENARKSFENNKVPFQASISTILDETNKILIVKGPVLIKTMTTTLDKMIATTKSYEKKFETTGAGLVDGLARGITRNQSAAVNAITNTSKAVTAAAKATFDQHSPSRVFEKIGFWLDVGLANGITNSSHLGVNATIKMGESMEEALRDTMGVHSESKLYNGIGEWAGKSVGNGWKKATTYANKKAKEFGIDTTKMSIKGVTETVSGDSSSITNAVTDLIDILSGSTEVSTSAGNAGTSIGNTITSGMNSALKNSKTGIGGTKTQATVKSELEKLQSALDESKYYGQLSLEEELKAYEAIQKVYKAGSEERKKIDREVYRLTKEIYDAQISYIDSVTSAEEEAAQQRTKLYTDYVNDVQKAENDAAKKLSDLKANYDKNVASARESARQKEQEKEKKYHEDINRILDNAENERKKLREEYSRNQLSINEKLLSDIESQNKAYEDAVKSRADAIYNSYGLFSKVEEDPEVTGDELLQNLRDQGAALSEWQQSLEELTKRGVGTALIEELQKLGPSSKAQIKALISLTDEQLTEYVGLFEGKYAFARVKAETELEGLKENTSQIIKDLKEQADIDLKNLDTSFAEAMAAVNAQMSADLATLKTTFDTEMSEIQSELSIKLAELKESFDTSSAEINADLAEKLSDMKKTYDESLTKINEDTANKLKELKASFSSTMKDTKSLTTTEMKKLVDENKTKLIELDKNTTAYMASIEKTYDKAGNEIVTDFASNMSKLNRNTSQSLNTLQTTVAPGLNLTVSQFEMAGYNAAAGFARGIDNGSYMAALSGQYLAQRAVDAAMMVLDEHSPSKVFHKIGSFASEGFANGITDAAELAVKASVKMAEGPIAAIAQALDSLENDMEYEPVISPVLDLSNISRTNLQGLFGSSIVSVGSIQRARESVQNGSTTNNTDSSIVNNFNIKELVVRKEDDIDKIAVSLYKKQQTDMRGRGIRPRLS